MKRVAFLFEFLIFLHCNGWAEDLDCRQAWMPTDAPAFCPWRAEAPLPESRAYHSVATANGRIYVLGGLRYDSKTGAVIYYDSTVSAAMGPDGRLGSWVAEPSFSGGRSGAASTASDSCIFLVGGSSSSGNSVKYFDDLQYAHILGNGGLSRWTTATKHLNTARSNLSLVAIKTDKGTFLNAVAGVTQIGADTVHLDTIEVARVQNDCSIGDWKIAAYHLKGGRSSPQALIDRNTMIVIGGWGDLDGIDVYSDAQTTTLRPDGSPEPWRTAASRLVSGIYGHATAIAAPANGVGPSLLLSVGGEVGSGAYADWISFAYIGQGQPYPESIGAWQIAGTGKLPSGRAGLAVVQSGERLYVIGGGDANGTYYQDVISSRIDFGHR
jgi:hypothetical protein